MIAPLAAVVMVFAGSVIPSAEALTASQVQKLVASDGFGPYEFGSSVALDGDTALIGAWRNYETGIDSGAAYVFVRNGTHGTTCGDAWCEQAKLVASDGFPDARFGRSVALDGDTALVGAFDYAKPGGSRTPTPGAAYVFVRNGSTWTEQAKLTASDEASHDEFGWSVALEGDWAVVGVPFDDDLGVNSGSVYVFGRSGDSWSEHFKLTASDGTNGAQFGHSVALDGDTMFIGVPFDFDFDDPSVFLPGAAYVFVRDGAHGTNCGMGWCELAKLRASDKSSGPQFGYSVALDGDTAMVTAPIDPLFPNESERGVQAGAVYMFGRDGSTWSETQKLTASDAAAVDHFGVSGALDGDLALVGAAEDDDKGENSGSVYVFRFGAGSWSEQAKVTASDGAAKDLFGDGVALDGGTALIGARMGGLGNAGAAYISALNQAPVAEAGQSQAASVGDTVQLDGTDSYDQETPTEDLLYAWQFTSIPAGSTAALSGANTSNPTFVADALGDYVVSLVVTDAGGLSSEPDEVTISSLNAPPNADAGPDQGTYVGALVTLDGSGSSDPNGDPLSYVWTMVTIPADSAASLANPNTAAPSFYADVPGAYDIELVVNDGYVDSDPDGTTVLVAAVDDYVCGHTGDALNLVANLPISSFTTKGNKRALENFLRLACESAQKGNTHQARHKLEQALERTDGCILRGTLDEGGGGQGTPPAKDYIINCAGQDAVYLLIQDALTALNQ